MITTSFLSIMALLITKKYYFKFFAFVTVILYLIIIFLGKIYGSISTGIISASMDSHPTEAIEFISTQSFPLEFLLVIPLFIFLNKIYQYKSTNKEIAVLSIILCISCLPFIKKAIEHEKPTTYLFDVIKEVKFISLLWETLTIREEEAIPIISEWENVEVVKDDYNYVIIIGESAQKKIFSCYGSKLKTTEPISSLDGWSIIGDAIAPATQTRYSIPRILSLNDNKSVNANLNIIDLANMAGFQTYWFSNQGSFGAHDTPITRIAKRANTTYFHNIDYTKTEDDSVLLDDLKQSLEDGNKKNKVIFLHTIGSHSDFCERTRLAKHRLEKSSDNSQIHCYNESILNTFEFIKEVQNSMVAHQLKYKIIYFSDHGLVDVNEKPFKNYGAGKLFAKEAVEVPLLFISDKPTKGKVINMTYFLRDFPHTFAELLGISAKQIDTSKSIKAIERQEYKQSQYVLDHSLTLRKF
jgi:glucan phosphoethanolaminetransferase (alkaline phosphatase superfamily)